MENYRDIVRQYSDAVEQYRTKVSAFERNYGPRILERFEQGTSPMPDRLRNGIREASFRIGDLAGEAQNLWYWIEEVGLRDDPNVRTDRELFDSVKRNFMSLLSEWHTLWDRTLSPPSQGGRRRRNRTQRRHRRRRGTQRRK
jgi:hypothetical protein